MPSLKAKLRDGIQAFLNEDGGATAIEYGLITAAMCTAVAAAVSQLGDPALWGVFDRISDHLSELTNP